MDGFLVSKTMFAACELGVFDILFLSEIPMSCEEIAKHLCTSVEGLETLLNACVGLKLLTAETGTGKVLYSNTDLSDLYLTKSSPKSLCHLLDFYSHCIYHCSYFLTDAVREGKSQHERAFGVSSRNAFDALYRSDEEMLNFLKLMNTIWNVCGEDVITAFDLSCFSKVCDLGGCTGAIAKQCIATYPKQQVIIFDLPKVLTMAKQHFISANEKRITLCEGNFFEDSIPEADLYILARIIHDWSEEKCLKLLKKVYSVCKSGGGILVIEAILNDDRCGPRSSQMLSLIMLIQTEGKERTSTEYSHLLENAGFKNIQVKRTGKLYDAILGRKCTDL
ncbi:acetylserotonin O-methyltransferase-like [Protopterus annectens]|uniref:acetylserotonin O-methyltransferase-like n=1 Tax=Protopterus annectens TaxID=7888 RepID=UPI001CFAAE37|nr:acetylserotonin O-methyltransferase-like [Protopterus annectens]